MACWRPIELGGEKNAATRLTVLRAIDKLDRLGETAFVSAREGRKDESGDFTKGAGTRRRACLEADLASTLRRPQPICDR